MSLSLTLSIYYLSMFEDFSMIEHKTIELAEYIVCVMKSLIHITTDHKSPIRLPCWLSLPISSATAIERAGMLYTSGENEEVIRRREDH